jgi:hypothetical protein
MVNYRCNAACRHCLYSCSPTRGGGYINEQPADEVCRLLRKGGCRSVHIGGGEPFLDFEGPLMMVRKLGSAGISLEYTETNAFWAADGPQAEGSGRKEAAEKLKRLLAEGADTLCISIDPYHAEYVPYAAPLALAELCDRAGMNYFLWKREFLPALSRLDAKKAHPRPEMEKVLSEKYIPNTARLYGIGYGGRAVNIEREFAAGPGGGLHPAEHFAGDASPCRNLLATGHFHVDMDCRFIPPRCTGIRLPLREAVEGIPPGKYAAFEALYSGGVSALLTLARGLGFAPGEAARSAARSAAYPADYPSKCGLCFHIRRFLSEKDFPELDRNHYEEALKYY